MLLLDLAEHAQGVLLDDLQFLHGTHEGDHDFRTWASALSNTFHGGPGKSTYLHGEQAGNQQAQTYTT